MPGSCEADKTSSSSLISSLRSFRFHGRAKKYQAPPQPSVIDISNNSSSSDSTAVQLPHSTNPTTTASSVSNINAEESSQQSCSNFVESSTDASSTLTYPKPKPTSPTPTSPTPKPSSSTSKPLPPTSKSTSSTTKSNPSQTSKPTSTSKYKSNSSASKPRSTDPEPGSVNQHYSPLGYRKYEISHTAQYIYPCLLTKFQQAIKKNNTSVLDLDLKLTSEEYAKLREIVLQKTSLAEKWKCQVQEATSFVTRDSKELKINRHYLTELCKHIKHHISSYISGKTKATDAVPAQPKAQLNTPKPVRTYSRAPKPPSSKVAPPKALPQPTPKVANDNCINLPPTKGIMDEYEVFCEKEQNLRKLLDAFPGADIMEAQDILVKCNWDLNEAVKIAHAQPLRCTKKKLLYANSNSSTENMPAQVNPENRHNSQSSNSSLDRGPKVAEEITLDDSDEEFQHTIKQMNSKRNNSMGKMPAAKRARKVMSSSESDEDMPLEQLNHTSTTRQISSTSNATSFGATTPDGNDAPPEQNFSMSKSMTIKAVPNTPINSEQPKKTAPTSNNMPNMPKGLSITQLGSSSVKLVSDSKKSEVSVSNSRSVDSVTMSNQKAEVISIPSSGQSNSSNKSAQLVRIKLTKNGVTGNKADAGYTIQSTGTVVNLPTVSKGMSITPVATSTQVMAPSNMEESKISDSAQGKAGSKFRNSKGKRKKYAPSEDEGDDYGNDDIYDSEDSDSEVNLTAAHSAVLKFFQEASVDELGTIPGCSKKKVEAILNIRPFANWLDLVQKIGNDRTLSTDLLNGAKKVLDMRNAINKLMAKCQQISMDMEDLVENLKENRESSENYVAKQPSLLNDKMHLAAYQMLGLNWLLLLHNQEVNGILADEMGLGKTIQAIAFLAYLKQINSFGPHLVVVPSSTLDNWKQEMRTWWPNVSVIVYHGAQESRRELRIQILNDEVEDFDVMITTYNMVTSSAEDRNFFKRLEFHYVVFDEAHMLKNMSSQRYQHLMRIKATRRLLLTGTPLQNNLVELMSLLIFAMPDMFSGKTEQVKQMFSAVTKNDGNKNSYEKDRIDHAKRIMKPFVLRRLKTEVLKDLPAKHEETRFCPMTEDQAQKYKDLVEKFSAEVENNKDDSNEKTSASGVGMMMQLRRGANHPLLLRCFYDDEKLTKMANDILQEPTHTMADPNLVFEDMSVMSDFELYKLCKQYDSLNSYVLPDKDVLNSGKFRVLDELLPTFISEDHRVLLFSQFTMVLDIVEEYMQLKGYKYMRLDGQTPVNDRQDMIDEFNNDSSISIFLLSTRAGGLGINLTAADTVILHDIDFNPYNDKQAEDRCHRVGQIRDVRVIRFISENSIEEGILQSAKEKLKLERDIHDETETEESDTASVAKLLRDALGLKNTKS